jgi:ribonuclease HI
VKEKKKKFYPQIQGVTTAIKTQALVDFILEWIEQQGPENPERMVVWKMYFDESLKLQGAGTGILFIFPKGDQLKYALQLLFPVSNNANEYEARIHGLSITMSLKIKRLMVYEDSLVVISQVNKDWDCSMESMSDYCATVRKIEGKFEGLEFHHVGRDRNMAADALSKLGSSQAQAPLDVFVQEVQQPSISSGPREECKAIEQAKPPAEQDPDDWRTPIIRYVRDEEEPDDKSAAERLVRQSAHYIVLGDTLYRRGVAGILMKYINTSTKKYLLEEIHAGQCGVHAASRTLVGKAFRAGFYWPMVKRHAADLVQRCEAYQFLAKQQHLPAQRLQTILVSWAFACWGLDMIGPFKKAQGGYTQILVAIDKFTKWIEYKPIASFIAAKAV